MRPPLLGRLEFEFKPSSEFECKFEFKSAFEFELELKPKVQQRCSEEGGGKPFEIRIRIPRSPPIRIRIRTPQAPALPRGGIQVFEFESKFESEGEPPERRRFRFQRFEFEGFESERFEKGECFRKREEEQSDSGKRDGADLRNERRQGNRAFVCAVRRSEAGLNRKVYVV